MSKSAVHYVPDLGVWVVDLGTVIDEAMAGHGGRLALRSALRVARENGELPECNCSADFIVNEDESVTFTEYAKVHSVFASGLLEGRFAVFGHGGMQPDKVPNAQAMNAQACPLFSADGEDEAFRLAKSNLRALAAMSVQFPSKPRGLEPTTGEAPKTWEGEPVRARGGTVPVRHVPAEVRRQMARLALAEADVERLNREAMNAEKAFKDAPEEARAMVRDAARNGKRADSKAVTALLRKREEEAQVAKAMAQGTNDAVESVRQDVANAIKAQKVEWRTYLSAHASNNLGRLDSVLSELSSVLDELALIDLMRQVTETRGGRIPFSSGRLLPTDGAVQSVREAREKAAEALGGLGKYAAKEKA